MSGAFPALVKAKAPVVTATPNAQREITLIRDGGQRIWRAFALLLA